MEKSLTGDHNHTNTAIVYHKSADEEPTKNRQINILEHYAKTTSFTHFQVSI